jgi:hypothetical protein
MDKLRPHWNLLVLLLLMVSLQQGCTIETRIDLYNGAGSQIQVDAWGRTVVIAPGSHAVIRGGTPLTVRLNNKVLQYDLNKLPRRYLRGTAVTPTLPVCLEGDLRLYVRKTGGDESKCDHVDPQPEPFPVTAR